MHTEHTQIYTHIKLWAHVHEYTQVHTTVGSCTQNTHRHTQTDNTHTQVTVCFVVFKIGFVCVSLAVCAPPPPPALGLKVCHHCLATIYFLKEGRTCVGMEEEERDLDSSIHKYFKFNWSPVQHYSLVPTSP